MPPTSLKKIGIAVLLVIAVAHLDLILAFASGVYKFFYDSFEGLRRSPAPGRLAVVTLILALLYVSVYTLLNNKLKK